MKNLVSWWDEECNKAKQLRRASFEKWEYTKGLEDLIEYKKLSALAQELFKKKKKECFREFAETINSRSNFQE